MTSIRCTQQDLIYQAQVEVPTGRLFSDHQEAQVFLDGLRDTWWWTRHYSRIKRVEVHPKSVKGSFGHAQALWYEPGSYGIIEADHSGLNERTLVHELAHIVTGAIRGPGHGHDPDFARTFCILTCFVSGSDAWLKLQAAFDRHGVDYMQGGE